ncbi:hypothetical protein NXC14_PA00001 (plasmid) [Rhizobium sp. NXC14]|nr:hypothetical protein NXC14_PA00001 [Rhizobium sp. NXC14]
MHQASRPGNFNGTVPSPETISKSALAELMRSSRRCIHNIAPFPTPPCEQAVTNGTIEDQFSVAHAFLSAIRL